VIQAKDKAVAFLPEWKSQKEKENLEQFCLYLAFS